MATLVKFLKEPNSPNPDGVLAYFPQLNWIPWSNLTKTSYAHIGQHSACTVEYAKTLVPVTNVNECKDLIKELKGLGYKLKVLNKFSNGK
jgi:hypothetical protein